MTRFRVNSAQLHNAAGSMQDVSRVMNRVSSDVADICNHLVLSGNEGYAVRHTLRSLSASIRSDAEAVSYFAYKTGMIANAYARADGQKVQSLAGLGAGAGTGGAGGGFKKGAGAGGVGMLTGTILGLLAGNGEKNGFTAEGDLLKGSVETNLKTGAKWKIDPKTGKANLDELNLIEGEIEGEAHLARGKIKGKYGFLSGEAEATVGQVKAKGSVAASLVKDGMLAPAIWAGAEAEATALSGKAKVKAGNLYGEAQGKVATASAKAEGGAGIITYTDKDGKKHTEVGVKGEAKAEAYLATGEVTGGFEVFGIKVGGTVTGKAGGAGVGVGGYATTGKVSGSLDLGLGIGAGLEVSIDWSGFKPPKLPKIKLPKIEFPKLW